LERTPAPHALPSFPTRRSSDLLDRIGGDAREWLRAQLRGAAPLLAAPDLRPAAQTLEQALELRRDREAQKQAARLEPALAAAQADRKSTRLNSSHRTISYAVFC